MSCKIAAPAPESCMVSPFAPWHYAAMPNFGWRRTKPANNLASAPAPDTPSLRALETAHLEAQMDVQRRMYDIHLQQMSRLLLEQAADGIYGLDSEGHVTFANRAACEMTGWTPETMYGQLQHNLVHHSHPDGSPYDRQHCPIYHTLTGTESTYRDDEVFWRKDGTCFPVSYTSTPILVEGDNIGAVIIFRDITQQVQSREWERRKSGIYASLLSRNSVEITLTKIAQALHHLRPTYAAAILAREGPMLHLRGEANLSNSLRTLLSTVPLEEATQLCGRVVLANTEMIDSRTFSETNGSPHQVATREWSIPLRTEAGETLGALSLFGQITPRDQEGLSTITTEAAELARLTLDHGRLQGQLPQ